MLLLSICTLVPWYFPHNHFLISLIILIDITLYIYICCFHCSLFTSYMCTLFHYIFYDIFKELYFSYNHLFCLLFGKKVPVLNSLSEIIDALTHIK